MFFSILISSVFLGLSSTSFFGFWVALELNMLSFVSLLSVSKPLGAFFNTAMYFLPQAISSSILLVSVLFMFYIPNNILMSLLGVAVALKLGLAPTHFWFIQLSKNMSFQLFIILSTIQKILPLWIFISVENMYFWALIVLSIVISVLGAIAQVSVMCLLAYSSIFSSTWVASSSSLIIGATYLTIYLATLYVFAQVASNTQSQFSDAFKSVSPMSLIIIIVILFSLMGIPPLMSFLPKLFILQELMFEEFFSLGFLLTMSSFLFFWVLCSLSLTMISTTRKTGLIESEAPVSKMVFIISSVLLLGTLIMLC